MEGDIQNVLDAMSQDGPSEELTAEVQEVVNTIVKTLKIFRTYPRENSMVKTAIDNLTSTFNDHFERHPNLELFVDRHQLQWKSMTVYSEPDQRRSFALRLDRDGVRRLLFKQGITRDEVLSFLEIMTAEISDESLNDDLVTLLWEKQLEHIKVFVLNEVAEEESFDPELVDADEPEDKKGKKRPDEDAGDSDVVTDVQQAVAALNRTCADTIGKLEPESEERTQTIKHHVKEETTRDASEDLVDILFDLILTEEDDQIIRNAVRVLMELVTIHIRNRDFAGATRAVERLRALAADDSGTLNNEYRAHIVDQLKSLASEKTANDLVGLLRQQEEASDPDIMAFLRVLPSEMAPRLCALLDNERFVPVLSEALPLLAVDQPEMLIVPFAESQDGIEVRLLQIISKVARAETVEALADVLPGKPAAVREASVPLLRKHPRDTSRKLLLDYAGDESTSLRRAALKALAEMGGGSEVPELRSQINAPGFEERTLNDKKELFITLARLEGAIAVPFLGAIARGRKWFESQQHQETRACAVFALGEIEEMSAREALERCANDKSQTVRAAANLALSRSASLSSVGS